MDDDRRGDRYPRGGRREEDALTRELVRALLKDDGYMTRVDVERDFVPRKEHHQQVVDHRSDIVIRLAIASLLLSPILSAVASHFIGGH